jgi:hypothetical protein
MASIEFKKKMWITTTIYEPIGKTATFGTFEIERFNFFKTGVQKIQVF